MPKKKRKGLSVKVRFEVFKRDNFKCQYCGAAAPDVLLQADHIQPVAGGGEDDLLNLITSCVGCNGGKGARPIGDRSAIEKQRQELEELNERRGQLEMMLEWRKELAGLKQATASALVSRIHELAPGWVTGAPHQATINRWLRDYALEELLDAAERSAGHYLRWDGSKVTLESWCVFFKMIPRIAGVDRAAKDEPYLRDLLYVRAVLKNMLLDRLGYQPFDFMKECMPLLKEAARAGVPVEDLKYLSKHVESWPEFFETVDVWIRDRTKRG
jgi:hypothetical protein